MIRSTSRSAARAARALLLAATLVAPAVATAGGLDDEGIPKHSPRRTAASVRVSVLYGAEEPLQGPNGAGHRSVPLALGLSAAVPGLGQAYNRQWIKAGIAIAAEIVLVAGYATWRSQGLDEQRAFQALAHARWSPGKYASWLNDYTMFLEANHGGSFSHEAIVVPGFVDFGDPERWSESERVAVHQLFLDIRSAESELFHPETGASFSHRLPDFGEQQYYELIGKYFQFAPGWDDYPEWIAGVEYTDAIDPERTDASGRKISVSPTFFSYAVDHAHSQDLLRRASQVTSLIVANHLIAAIDAAVFARLHNRRLTARVDLVSETGGRYVPRARFAYRF